MSASARDALAAAPGSCSGGAALLARALVPAASAARLPGAAARQVPLLRHRRAGDGSGLGLRGHPQPRATALFFALGGYGMGMYLMRSIAGEGVYRSDAARLHGLPRLERAALVLARLPELPVRGGDGAGGARPRWRWCSAGSRSARASAASTSRSSPRRSPTRRRCCSSRTPPASAATTVSPTSSASSAGRCTTRRRARCSTSPRRSRWSGPICSVASW